MRTPTPPDRAAAAVAAVLLGYAIQRNDGFYDPVALALVCVSIAALIAALTGAAARVLRGAVTETVVTGILVIGILGALALLASTRPAMYIRTDPHPPGVLAGLGAAALCAVLLAADRTRGRRVWFPALLLIYLALGTWLIRASPNPHVDVITVHDRAIAALSAGDSPYGITFPNIYGRAHPYPPGTVRDGQVQFGFPYPPLALMLAVPSERLLGDIRYADLFAVTTGAGLIGYAGGPAAPLAATLLLFTPRTLFVLEQGWTESLAIGWLGATVYGIRKRRRWAPLAAGLLAAVKQHLSIALILLPMVLDDPWSGRRKWTFVARAFAVAAALTLPFVLRDPGGFWRSVVWAQFAESPRGDSLSLLSLAMRQGWSVPAEAWTLLPLAGLAAGFWLVWRYAPRTSTGFSFGLALVLLLVFVVSKKAFANYYYFVIAAIAAGIAAAEQPPGARAAPEDV